LSSSQVLKADDGCPLKLYAHDMSVHREGWGIFANCFAASIISVALCNASVAQQKSPATAAQPQPAQIDRNGTLILIRTTLIALDQANKPGNYSVLRALCAPAFQATNSPERLAEIFASHRAQGLDLSGVVAIDPQLTLLPQIEANGMLHIAGFFPSVPSQVYFEFLFAPVDGLWRPFGISVNLRSAAPQAPPQSQAPAQPRGSPQQGQPAGPKAPQEPSRSPKPQ
jgi:hypothetical protein